jgi:hypothetical protein
VLDRDAAVRVKALGAEIKPASEWLLSDPFGDAIIP